MAWTEIGSIQSESSKNTHYAISVNGEGDLGCKCHSWTHSKLVPKTCKHVESAEAGRLLEAYQRRFAPPAFKIVSLSKSRQYLGWPTGYVSVYDDPTIAKLQAVVDEAQAVVRASNWPTLGNLQRALRNLGVKGL